MSLLNPEGAPAPEKEEQQPVEDQGAEAPVEEEGIDMSSTDDAAEDQAAEDLQRIEEVGRDRTVQAKNERRKDPDA